ncbi:zinc transporter ZIP1-like [Limulus polyphemus]|uniref:Zinc transporter ZIP1-like n=1 Tax=Limulus polyphemus TaxID=6850 RepID=A0ABM1BJF1_LIMPO|nr:zinc transporter ZIP1-like [Limulus polyphemus]
MLLIVARVLTLIFLFLGTLLCGTFPLLLIHCLQQPSIRREAWGKPFISLLLNFGGGVLLSVSFLHLLPEVRNSYESYWGSNYDQSLPLAELIVCVGLLTIYVLEEVFHTVIRCFGQTPTNNDCCAHEQWPVSLACSQRNSEIERRSSHDRLTECNNRRYGSLDLDDQPTGGQSSTRMVLFRGLVIVLALSFHSVVEGLAVGLQPTVQDTWTLFFAEAVHKFIIAFALGLELHNEGNSFRKVGFYMLVFSVMTPLGIGIAVLTDQAVTQTSQLVIGTLNGLACGTLIYVTFFEVLQRSRSSLLPGLLQLLAVILGFGFMTVVRYFLHHHH